MKRHLLVALLLTGGCTVGDDPMDVVNADFQLGSDPCNDAQLREHINVHATPGNPHRFVGTEGNDVIFGTDGDDRIFGLGGDDIICAGAGNDYVDGGDGKDYLYGGAGDDIIHGRGGSDHIWGGAGDDILFGDILDDKLFGEEGNDILIGGHGTDLLDGGPGNDFLRGDTGNDDFEGGEGYDIASFATATPPGQPEVEDDGTQNIITGIAINAKSEANGDGGQEPVHGIEEVVGSEFTDRIPSTFAVQPTLGEGTPTPQGYAFIRGALDHKGLLVDVGVVVLGTATANNYQIVGKVGNVVDIIADNPPAAGDGCVQLADRTRCDVDAFLGRAPHHASAFHYILAWMDGGNDKLQITGSFPREFEVTADGGPGDDHLIGGDEQDIFFTGVDGTDWLEGNGGDDALISESHHTALWANGDRPRAEDYHDGADTLDGGAGNDQLVSDYVCGGHRYIGGPGNDIAGFARSGFHPIHAQLGGPAKTKTNWWGFAANMDLCGNLPGRWTSWKRGEDADLETLEASDGDDFLWGDDRSNTIWGRDGADHIDGLGGKDTIAGANGNDTIVKHPGDTISYGADEN